MIAPGGQLPLPLGHRPARGREDFLVAPANAEAVAWLDRWPDWPAPVLVLSGPDGCGKSHLVQVFADRARAVVCAGAAGLVVDPPSLLARASLTRPAVAVDDADAGLDEVALFHLINAVREASGSLLLTAATPPARWGVALPDLRSRLNAAPAVGIGPPDDAVMVAVLVKLFSDRQVRVGTEVIAYLLGHMERSYAAARDTVALLDALSLAEQRPITVPLARRALSGSGAGG